MRTSIRFYDARTRLATWLLFARYSRQPCSQHGTRASTPGQLTASDMAPAGAQSLVVAVVVVGFRPPRTGNESDAHSGQRTSPLELGYRPRVEPFRTWSEARFRLFAGWLARWLIRITKIFSTVRLAACFSIRVSIVVLYGSRK